MCHLVFFLEAYATVAPGGRDAHLPETRHTDFLPVLKNRDEKAQQMMKKKNVFKKQVGVKKKRGLEKKEERLSYSWYQGSAPAKPTINYCWHEAQPFSRRPAGTQQSRAGLVPAPSQARASLPAAAPGQQTRSWPDTSPRKCCHLSAFIKAHQSCCSSKS